jgi:cellulose synthase/poly-beta-1,6-N-acetylglucosamine synthase-like glycosyltransferase
LWANVAIRIVFGDASKDMTILGIVGIMLAILGIYRWKLKAAIQAAPQVKWEIELPEAELPQVTVIVPAYNESDNIRDCLSAVLASSEMGPEQMRVVVIDDQSTDETLAIAQAFQSEHPDPRLQVIAGQPRPDVESWAGKNWACHQAIQHALGDYLLFIDADVRLKPGAIAAALRYAQQQETDLLSCGPEVVCGCFAEWLVQPLILNVIMVGFQFDQVNDPASQTAFAAGPFMLFRRAAYETIGGHRAVADQVVEDVELARLVKSKGLRLRYVLGIPLASVQMYRNWKSLWEGWTKNLYLGSQRDFPKTVLFMGIVLLVCTLPWVLLLVALLNLAIAPSLLHGITLALAIAMVSIHYVLRWDDYKAFGLPTTYWWLTGLGGLAVVAIALASVIKTETGWGWTWRGRSLQLPKARG